MLVEYNRIEEFKFYDQKLSCSSFRDYSEFKKIVNAFVEKFNLKQFELKDIDKFLWIYSKQRDVNNT